MTAEDAATKGAFGMSFRHVEAFLAVAECRSITAAASRMHMTQSGLSRVIRALEQEVGEPLFERRAQGLLLTAAGQMFMPFARQLAATYAEAVGVPGSAGGGGL